jgi:hypothetical protein
MILIILLIFTSMACFTVGLVSPMRGTQLQAKALYWLNAILSRVRNKPHLAKAVVGKPSKLSHKTIHHSTKLGKQARRKVEQLMPKA